MINNYEFNKAKDNINKDNIDKDNIGKVGDSLYICPVCGTKFSDFEIDDLLGCETCYEQFNKYLMVRINKIQGSTLHSGKTPGETKSLKEKEMIFDLKEKLNEAILIEDFEKAALIRDEINLLTREIEERN